MAESGRAGTVPTPAATVVPIRDTAAGIEVLLLRRDQRGPFGGMWVFPGGKVDPVDLDDGPGGPSHSGEESAEIAGARRAAVREAFEEATLELDEAALVTLSFWLPPPEAPRRFATWFFLAEAGGEVVVDRGEIHEHRWVTPADAMASRDAGEIELAPPTYTTLWWVGRQADVASALRAASERPPDRFETRVVARGGEGLVATLWEGDAGYDSGDLERPGPRRRLWMGSGGWRIEMSG